MNGNKVHPLESNVSIEGEIYKHFTVRWNDLSYEVNKNFIERQIAAFLGQSNIPMTKTILKGIKGEFKSGQLTAIMGPSGAGKSTLLESIAGLRVKGRSGSITFHGQNQNINMAFIPQNDSFFNVLTVRESIVFASKLQNSTKAKNKEDYLAFTIGEHEKGKPTLSRSMTISDKSFHHHIANNIMSLLGLEEAADVPTGKISGGQKKRLSIAQELVSKPNILILDEPTSGLDSSASQQCIQLLQSLTQHKLPMAIVCTIHQPNPNTFNLFHKVYILSVVGKCIYEGSPSTLIDHLKNVDIECPSFYNPADFIIEIASGEHSADAIAKLVAINESEAQENIAALSSPKNFEDVLITPTYPFFDHFMYLFHRSFLLIIRNPMLFWLRLASHTFLALFIGWIYGPNVGKAGGCPPDLENGFSPEGLRAATNASMEQTKSIIDNFSCLFFNMLIILFSAMMPTIISFPLEMLVFVKEKRNNWYGVGSYFFGMMLADTPFQIIFPTMYVMITYYMTGQIRVLWRFESYLLINILIALISQCQGLIMGAIFMHNMTAAVYIGPLTALPLLLFSGFLVKIETIPALLRPLSNLSYVRFSFEGAIISIYGFDRCGEDVKARLDLMQNMLRGWFAKMLSIVSRAINEKDEDYDYGYEQSSNSTVDENETTELQNLSGALVDTIIAGIGGGMRNSEGDVVSGVMALFDLEDHHLYRSFILLLIFFVLLRVATYFFVLWRSNSRK
ncbi:ATP-binding cassette sub-family G member 1-like protein [Dinothrombium tinctorium]|uniref:ATP-binding cassette sub-family G member 1-like protein n=1 Tax=Dinothrombium tinctorium TaxID=1965070 RepID=A0A443QUH5_9ACAR|nr:ATP-binding cassette sub-family G member 1-like protein [Dinothrombium tinctorium]